MSEENLEVEQLSYRTWRVIDLIKETRHDIAYDPVHDRFLCDCQWNSIHPQIPCRHIRAVMRKMGYARKRD